MTLALSEVVKLIKRKSQTDIAVALIYQFRQTDQYYPATATDLRKELKRARYSKADTANWPNAVARCSERGWLEATGDKRDGKNLWMLTNTGEARAQELLGIVEPLGERSAEVVALSAIANTLPDVSVRDYLLEGIKCLGVGALRASIVFVWSGAMRLIQQSLFSKYSIKDVNDAICKHYPKAKVVNSMDDWAYIKDELTLQAAADLKIFNKPEHTVLGHGLGLRNQYGHPSTLSITVLKARATIEDLINLVFKRLS